MQIYIPVDCESEISYNENLKSLVQQISKFSTEERAKGIPTLPENLYYEMLTEYPCYQNVKTKLPVGIDMENLEVQYLDVKAEAALIIGNSGMGRTNMLKNVLNHISGNKVYLIDARNRNLRLFEREENIVYAGNREQVEKVFGYIRDEINTRKEMYDGLRDKDKTLKEYGYSLKPVYIVVDIIQELQENLDGDNEKLDILAEAVQCGIYVIVTADVKLRARTSKFLNMLTECKGGLVLGNIKEQGVFSYTGIREENRKCELGYYHIRGENKKVKLIEAM